MALRAVVVGGGIGGPRQIYEYDAWAEAAALTGP